MKQKSICIRCEVLEKKVKKKGVHKFVDVNGLVGLVCKECLEELKLEEIQYEIKEDESSFGEIIEEV